MLEGTAVDFFNRLLAQAHWARLRLAPFAGQTLRIEAGTLTVPLSIAEDGQLRLIATAHSAPAVTVSLPADWLLRFLTDRNSLFSQSIIAGSVDFAEAAGFVMRNLTWDVESELAPLFGDVVAHRLVQAGKRVISWQSEAVHRFSLNLVEFLVEETSSIASKRELRQFCSEVSTLRDDCSRLEQRLAAR